MNKIYLTSDLHFGHDRAFIYRPRGFSSSEEHDEAVIRDWNAIVDNEDDVYILGDLILGDSEAGIKKLERLNGKLHIIFGNHDTDSRKELYKTLPNVIEICGWATVIKYRKYHFYLSHFPTDTGNLEENDNLRTKIFSISGHTHDIKKFHENNIMKYNVALEAHNNHPVLLDAIINDIKNYNVALDKTL